MKKKNFIKKYWDRFLDSMFIFHITEFIKEWIYPAWSLKNLLYNRYDRVTCKELKATQYCDIRERMFYVNMELINDFIENEKPEEHVCWYKDDKGEDVGAKYGMYPNNERILFPEYQGKYILDIVKEIYNWYNIIRKEDNKDYEYLLSFWCDNFCENDFLGDYDDDYEYDDDDIIDIPKKKIITTIEELNNLKDLNWNILNKYFPNKEEIIKHGQVFEVLHNLEHKLELDKQKYLHLAIECRLDLWT